MLAVIYLHPREVTIERCDVCGLTHPNEETACVASRGPYNTNGIGSHCEGWWDGEGCCWCGDDPCRAAAYALG